MLGSSLDYMILRGFAHRRNLATEDELDSRFGDVSGASLDDAMPKARKLIARFEGHLPLSPELRYLDIGCGTGELTVALARMSGARFTGLDFLPRSIERARAFAERTNAAGQVRFICQDVHTWQPPASERFDVLMSFDAFEHIDEPRAFLERMADFAAPGGIAVLAFGPLFHSPFGDHMWDFFRVQIPWRGVLFPEPVVLRVRRECFRPTDPAQHYREIAGGLNLMRYSEFLEHVAAAGWEFEHLAVNTFLLRWPMLRFISDRLLRIPFLRDYFAHNVYAVLRRRDGQRHRMASARSAETGDSAPPALSGHA